MVPVHGEYRHLHAHAALARRVGIPFVEFLEDGDRITLDGRKTTVQRRAFEAGYVYLDAQASEMSNAVCSETADISPTKES